MTGVSDIHTLVVLNHRYLKLMNKEIDEKEKTLKKSANPLKKPSF